VNQSLCDQAATAAQKISVLILSSSQCGTDQRQITSRSSFIADESNGRSSLQTPADNPAGWGLYLAAIFHLHRGCRRA
jgi:hypothetical protein